MTAQASTGGQPLIGAPIVSRFAPSPTGRLHLGHAYSAIIGHDLARRASGRFIVRIEDLDQDRQRAEFVAAIFEDLTWLGLTWDAVRIQSANTTRHKAAIDRLRASNMIYPCRCTRADIAASTTAPQGDRPPVYPGTCRGRLVQEPAAMRLDMMRATGVTDPARDWGDIVVVRKDAVTSYHVAVTVDDADDGVTDVVRGRDLLPATDVHRVLQKLLGLPTPRYCHHRLICGADGKRLAKRKGSTSLADLRAGGVDGQTLANDLRVGRLPIGFQFDSP